MKTVARRLRPVLVVGFLHAAASGVHAQCSDDVEQRCRLETLRCIAKNCAGVTTENERKDRDCRSPCYTQLLRCRQDNFCK